MKYKQLSPPSTKTVNKMKSGTPRLDPVERLLHRLYEPLVLLMVLERTRGRKKWQSDSDSSEEEFPATWPKFLDSLSLTCDNKTGGEAVSSVALEDTPSQKIYWLAGTRNSAESSRDLLSWILGQLGKIYNATPQAVTEIEESIATKSIEFGKEKIKNYARRLCNAIEDIEERSNQSASEEDVRLFQNLRKVTKFREFHQRICELCNDFRKLPASKHLSRKIDTASEVQKSEHEPSDAQVWSQIRHYMGRLGGRTRAPKLMVEFARENPKLFEDAIVEMVPSTSPTPLPAADGKTDLKSALNRMVQSDDPEKLQQALSSVERWDGFLELTEKFKKKYTSPQRKPLVHAEALMLQHFWNKKLKFFGNRLYIGCSKPSCYCCGLYFDSHASRPSKRDCHNNVWTNWASPDELRGDGSQIKAARRVLNDMIREIRNDVFEQFNKTLNRQPANTKIPDSTTGTWSVIVETGHEEQQDELETFQSLNLADHGSSSFAQINHVTPTVVAPFSSSARFPNPYHGGRQLREIQSPYNSSTVQRSLLNSWSTGEDSESEINEGGVRL